MNEESTFATNKDIFSRDVTYPSDNDLEIPTLRLDMQANECGKPFCAFGEQKRTFDLNYSGCLHFYVDDYRFNAIWAHPEKILQSNPRAIVEPNFSLFADTPISFGLQSIYKKRFLARFMQERGIRVFVDLNVNAKFYKLNMLGVPFGWSSFATRGYSDRLANLEYEYNIAKSWAQSNPLTFVIYGGGIDCRHFAQKHGCIYITPLVVTKNKKKALKAIEKECMFDFGKDFDINRLLTNYNPYNEMIQDFSTIKTIE